nr:E3 SUMO-protein ligase ZBED1-like [Nothobranchius furzeri]
MGRGAVGQTSRQRSTATGSSVTQTLEQAFQKQTDYVPASQKAQELTAAIAYLIAKDMMPFRIVERPGFLRMMKVAVPHYKVPTRNYFSKTEIPKMYNAVKADVKKSLAQGEFFAATTDFWTSERGGGLPYISFTVHYLTPDWQLESHCLETQFFPEVHSAQNIAEFFENMLEEWEINKTDLVSITTDNAANMTKAFEEFPDVWLGCFGHNLNLAISKALKIQRVETAVRTCRHLVQGFSRSWKRKRGLREKQAALTLPPLALIHDVVTRWGSTYKMLERFISQQQAVCATLAAERGAWHLMPKDTDIIVMEQVCQLLEPLSKFTDALCSETRVTLSAIKPVLDHITGDVLEENEAEPALTKQMKHAMREDLNNRYTEKAKDVMQMACFIDPRFKNNFLDAPVDDVVDRCVQEALKLTPVQVKQEPQSTSSNSTAAAGGKGLAGLLKKITSTRQQRSEEGSGPATPEDKVKEEVKVYMSLPSIPADDDPLVWWRGHASELPHLARLITS